MQSLNYNQFAVEVKKTPRGRDLKMSEIYHLYLLYCAAKTLEG